MERSPALKTALFNKARHLGHLAALQMMRTIAGYSDHTRSVTELNDQLRPRKVPLELFPPAYRNGAAMPGRLQGIKTDILDLLKELAPTGTIVLDRPTVDRIRRELPLVPVAVFVACAGVDSYMDVLQIARRRMALRDGEYYPILLPDAVLIDVPLVNRMVEDAFETEGIYTVVTIEHSGCPDAGRSRALHSVREAARTLGMDTLPFRAMTNDGMTISEIGAA